MNFGWLDSLVYKLRRHKGKIFLANAAALLAASWLPASIMVRTQTLPGQAEHALAYFATGICVTLFLHGLRSPLFIAAYISIHQRLRRGPGGWTDFNTRPACSIE